MKNYLKVATVVAVCLTAVFGANQALAQKVYVAGGKVYLDFGPGTGFPQGAVTTVSKIQTGTPSNTAWFPSDAVNGHNGTLNATVYRKLEVAKADGPTNNWAAAYLYCRDTYPATGGGTGWRLPTQRELMALFVFKPAFDVLLLLPTVSGTVFVGSAYYWSATESSTTAAWFVLLGTGTTSNYINTSKAGTYSTRCVREVSE